jgi:hypothetical protein
MQLAGCAFISQLHGRLTREVLGLQPKVLFGLSSGETNGMYALGLWSEPERLFDEIRESELYTRHRGGDFASEHPRAIALQACGWLSSFVLEPEFASWEPLFRNLDGVGAYYREVGPGDGVMHTRVDLTSRVVLGQQIIVRFHVLCTLQGERVFECKTTFGSFSPAALADTKGMIPAPAEWAAVRQADNCAIDLEASRERYQREQKFNLPGPRLLRLDRATGIWPRGGAFGLGYIRAEKDISKRRSPK